MKKKMTNDEKIIAALDALDRSKMNLMKFGDRYDGYKVKNCDPTNAILPFFCVFRLGKMRKIIKAVGNLQGQEYSVTYTVGVKI